MFTLFKDGEFTIIGGTTTGGHARTETVFLSLGDDGSGRVRGHFERIWQQGHLEALETAQEMHVAAQRETQEAVERERRGMRQEDHREAENDARSLERLRMQLEDAAAYELRENLRSAPEAGARQADAEAIARRRE